MIPKTYLGGGIHPRAEDSEFILEIEGLSKLEYKQDFSICYGLQQGSTIYELHLISPAAIANLRFSI